MIEPEWVHLAYQMSSALREVFGYAGRQSTVNLEGIRFRSPGRPSRTLLTLPFPIPSLTRHTRHFSQKAGGPKHWVYLAALFGFKYTQ